MAEGIAAARQQEQDAYLAACTALLVAIATNTRLSMDEVDTLAEMFIDLSPVRSTDLDLAAGLRLNLCLHGLSNCTALDRLA